jgi:hypothetical protein
MESTHVTKENPTESCETTRGDNLSVEKITGIVGQTAAPRIRMPVVTEDLGKMTEMAVCLLYNTPYIGPFKYSMEASVRISKRLSGLLSHHPLSTHTAAKGSRYDFSDAVGLHLSVKTAKKSGKVCPQVVGQPTRKVFCSKNGLHPSSTPGDIKSFLQTSLPTMLATYDCHTWDCPNLYYNEKKDLALYIVQIAPIKWADMEYEFSHIRSKKVWEESTTLFLKDDKKAIGEFQVHNHRSGVKFRWNYEYVLSRFPSHFVVNIL